MIQDTAHAVQFATCTNRVASESTVNHGASAFFAELYSELHRIALGQLARHGSPNFISPTTLLHETYLSLVKGSEPSFPDRFRLLGYAARAMRGVIIDHARQQQAQKRGGSLEITSIQTDAPQSPIDGRELMQIDETLGESAEIDSALAEVVDLKFFFWLSFAEIAEMRGVSERTHFLSSHYSPRPAIQGALIRVEFAPLARGSPHLDRALSLKDESAVPWWPWFTSKIRIWAQCSNRSCMRTACWRTKASLSEVMSRLLRNQGSQARRLVCTRWSRTSDAAEWEVSGWPNGVTDGLSSGRNQVPRSAIPRAGGRTAIYA